MSLSRILGIWDPRAPSPIYHIYRRRSPNPSQLPPYGRPPYVRPNNWASQLVKPIAIKCDLVGFILMGFGPSNGPKFTPSCLPTPVDDPKE